MIALFLVVAATSTCTYWLLAALAKRRVAARALRRLAPGLRAQAEARRGLRPVLIQAADEARGRMALGIMQRLRMKQSADALLETAGVKWGAAGLAHRSIALFLAGFGLVTLLTGNSAPGFALAGGAALGGAPFAWVRRRAWQRLHAFEEQFPDCLEFISRSMRAGHAFSVALEMVQREFSDPLAVEFRRAFEEQNLGQALEVVLRKLSQRVPSMDVQFFVSAVLLQKRTGGNLAELLDKLAQIIRERFKLRARIRAVSAQGLMSGRILSSIPPGVAALMFVVNPQYARFFLADPVGHELLAAGIALQVIGYLIIRRIVTFEVP
jgi:tight adherence protein B